LREAIQEEMRRDKNVFVMGEDVAYGVFGVTRGLIEEFGEARVRNTPISESGFVGAGVGAAMMGMKPIVEVMFMDWITLAIDQIVNAAAKIRYVSAGKLTAPVVIRTAAGAGIHLGPHHSQSFESWFIHVPGIKVALPSTPYDAKGLLKTAIRSEDPVLFVEHKLLYDVSGPVPEEEYTIPFGKADVKKEGNDVTVVATLLTVHKALSAARKLEKQGIDVEVIDPRTIQPIDKETIIESVKKTGRLVIAHEAQKTGGVGAEIASFVAEEAIDYLQAPIKRLGAPDVPTPFSMPLEKFWLSYSDESAIINAIKEIA